MPDVKVVEYCFVSGCANCDDTKNHCFVSGCANCDDTINLFVPGINSKQCLFFNLPIIKRKCGLIDYWHNVIYILSNYQKYFQSMFWLIFMYRYKDVYLFYKVTQNCEK